MESNKIKHLAIIPDGNRRWAKRLGLKEYEAHEKPGSYSNISPLFKAADEQGVENLSIWAFSTNNWNRSTREVEQIFRVVEKGLDDLGKLHNNEQYRFRMIGRKDRIPSELARKASVLEGNTSDSEGMGVILAVDYGGRDEAIRAMNEAIRSGKELRYEEFSQLLDTRDLPDPDLIIRTGGEKRLSGYMPLQSVYSEMIFLKKYFPQLKPRDIIKSIREFESRERRLGR